MPRPAAMMAITVVDIASLGGVPYPTDEDLSGERRILTLLESKRRINGDQG